MRVCVCVYRCVFIMYYGCVWGWSMAVAFVVYVCLLWDCLKWVWVSLWSVYVCVVHVFYGVYDVYFVWGTSMENVSFGEFCGLVCVWGLWRRALWDAVCAWSVSGVSCCVSV